MNLAKNNCQGPWVYNQEVLDYVKKYGKPITEIPTEEDTFYKGEGISPLISLVHVPTGKVNAYKNWFYDKGNNVVLIHDSPMGGGLKPTNDDFMYMLYSDDVGGRKRDDSTKEIIYDKKLADGIGYYTNFKDDSPDGKTKGPTDAEFIKNRKAFDSSYTEEEKKSDWYAKALKYGNITKKESNDTK